MYKPLESASKEELLIRYDNGIAWLDSHMCQTGTNNMLDVNGQLYEPEKFEKACKMLEDIEDTLNKRFPGWKNDRGVTETVSKDKVDGFINGYFNLAQLNPTEQTTVLLKMFPGSRVVTDEEFHSETEQIKNLTNK